MTTPNLPTVFQAVIHGIENAFAQYQEWSGGEWLHQAPEYLQTVEIARELKRIGTPFIELEKSVSDSIVQAGIKGPGPLPKSIARSSKDSGKSGAFDLFIWKEETPWGIIEVKRQPNGTTELASDLTRTTSLLAHRADNNPLEFGISAFFFSAPWKDNIDALVQSYVDFASGYEMDSVSLSPMIGKTHNAGEDGSWKAVCLAYIRK
ncbi:MAG: hypothetical protein A2527_01115 [Candidatus Lambdaproteobacteria bacterium RIFOXYD2_FULL_50_16]|uniref:Restriction endonuclease n=1 Tax=Candidatus Lambdaproteobacteria bacterium RIFOXYD2_FULL_50_16 TaxID=1817772 RepID=A0A1F6G9L8_9PROT|nr:MAG: hypothetical protein A2527_01115 [Candidatus Lambdaproteobacteria bacterium RIFOXYD2_FULL_50_16]